MIISTLIGSGTIKGKVDVYSPRSIQNSEDFTLLLYVPKVVERLCQLVKYGLFRAAMSLDRAIIKLSIYYTLRLYNRP